jgi:hypothetical protein
MPRTHGRDSRLFSDTFDDILIEFLRGVAARAHAMLGHLV